MSKRDGKRHPVIRDWHLWTEVTRTVRPLRPAVLADPAPPEPEPLPLPPVKPKPAFVLPRNWTVGSAVGPAQPAPGYTPPKKSQKIEDRPIEPKMRRKLGRGQIEIDGTIDLHGMRQDEARSALQRFLTSRAARGDRTVLVITGKGIKQVDATTIVERGVLRTMLPRWLGEPSLSPLIAGWSASAQHHGGDGAWYIRLRRVAQ